MQVQKDTILLNYCIGDIETLCTELKKSRKKAWDNSSRNIESYKATEFLSIFQKFKLALNLLVSAMLTHSSHFQGIN